MNTDFIQCKGSASEVGRLLEIAFNTETDKAHDLWYKLNDDFKATEWAIETDITTEDANLQGGYRNSQDVTNFSQTLTATLTDDNASGLLQRMYEYTLGDDNVFFKMLDIGLRIRTTIALKNGVSIRKTYDCCTITELGALLEQLKTQDSETALTVSLNSEPLVENIGFSGAFPSDIVSPSATITAVATDLDVLVGIEDVVDPDNLILTPSQFIISLYDNKTRMLIDTGSSDGTTDATVTADIAGDYTVVVGYSFAIIDGTKIYRNFYTKKLTLTA